MLAFIPDGYTRTVGFDKVAGLHDAFHVTYRPFSGGEASERWGQLLVSDKIIADSEAMVVERLSAWSFKDVKISPERVHQLASPIFDKIKMLVLGKLAPDWDAENGAAADAELEGKDTGN